jgi:hypothetical protein
MHVTVSGFSKNRSKALEDRPVEGVQRVEYRSGRMRKGGGVDNDSSCDLSRLMDPFDEFVFAVRLVKSQFKSEVSGHLAASGFDVSKRFVAANVRLALAKKIEVGTIEDVDDTTHG